MGKPHYELIPSFQVAGPSKYLTMRNWHDTMVPMIRYYLIGSCDDNPRQMAAKWVAGPVLSLNTRSIANKFPDPVISWHACYPLMWSLSRGVTYFLRQLHVFWYARYLHLWIVWQHKLISDIMISLDQRCNITRDAICTFPDTGHGLWGHCDGRWWLPRHGGSMDTEEFSVSD